MNKEEKREMIEVVWEKIHTTLTGITDISNSRNDKYAAEAAHALTNVLLGLQLVKPTEEEEEQ